MRSVIKGPYIQSSLLDKVKKYIKLDLKTPIKTRSRRSTIISDFVGLKFDIYNGRRFNMIHISSSMIGHKLGEFSPTRTFVKHSGIKVNNKKTIRKK